MSGLSSMSTPAATTASASSRIVMVSVVEATNDCESSDSSLNSRGFVRSPVRSSSPCAPKMADDTIGICVGRGKVGPACTSARPISAALERSSGSERPALSSTAARPPKSADTGNNLSTRADMVPTTESVKNGTVPVTASTKINANA